MSIATVVMLAVSCSGGSDSSPTTLSTEAPTTSTTMPPETPAPAAPMFGDMPSPCGPASSSGIPTVAEGQNGGSPLKLGTASDHGAAGSDQPTLEMLDAARAFAAWCNDRGGIRGLPIEIVDLDAALVNVPLAMEQTCAEVFAMVGGGWTLDDQMYPRFHECGMISFPAFTVTAPATRANGRVQPIPSPIDSEATTWLEWIADTYADAAERVAIVYADIMPTQMAADRLAATMNVVGGFGDPLRIGYDISQPADWTDVIEQMSSSTIASVAFIGDPGHLVGLLQAMDAAAFDVDVVFGDAQLATDTLASAAPSMSTGAAESTPGQTSAFSRLRIRTVHAPLSESDSAAGIASYLDMMRTLAPTGRLGSLGIHTTSAMLLFVTAANSCLDTNDNVLERECVLSEAQKITGWTAGELHTVTEPGTDEPSTCIVVIGLENGTWTRVHPSLDASADEDAGFDCDGEIAVIEGDFGDVTAGIDPSRVN